ncbi:YfhO family protein [Aerococcaceae bacterium zg-BR9]|uniref:YfhO family protein n=2 Tax=Aerococcaceae bacterium zg-1292 TaxID=2774330 RepID=UPI004062FC50|nr:YfhO family protein [Aerococcaceae bacterium zg-BR9]MBF6979238.1 YfhO family protein [Aerococcaceae bacterium zg-BR22]
MASTVHFKRIYPYIACGSIFSLLFLIISYQMQWLPFGPNTMLTIDLGQQYIDFFSYYRETLLHNPSQLFYSFQKGIGGEMVGLWTYYLLSPFNVILLLFQQNQLAQAVTVLTYVKLSVMTLTFFHFTRKKYQIHTSIGILFSLSYTFMSYTVAYWLNIMWLDGLVWLPLLALYLHRLITTKRVNGYLFTLTILFISNYYIGFIVAIFLAFYAIYLMIEQRTVTLKQFFRQYTRFITTSCIATLLSGITLYPAVTALFASKVNGTSLPITNTLRYLPKDIFAKLFSGSFNYEAIKNGTPQLYAGVFIFILTIIYFLSRQIKWQEKLVAVILLIVFLLAFMYEFPAKIWHGGQDPVWYPFRFSFLATFFSIELAIKSYQSIQNKLSLPQTITTCTLLCAISIYYWTKRPFYPHLTPASILITLGLGLLFILLLRCLTHRQYLLLVVALIDLGLNSQAILKHFNYVPFDRYQHHTTALSDTMSSFADHDNDFYRIQINAARTKNEPLFAHYNGLNHFSSTLESATTRLFGYLGLPDTQASTYYGNGTLFTDDFFTIKYLLEPKPLSQADSDKYFHIKPIAQAFDSLRYHKLSENPYFSRYENTDRLGLLMEVSPAIVDAATQFQSNQPVANQELLLRLIDFMGDGTPYYTEKPLSEPELTDVAITRKEAGGYYRFQSLIKDVVQFDKGSINYNFSTDTNNPYYLSLPSQINDQKLRMELDKEEFVFASPFRQRQLVSVADNQALTNHVLSMILQTPSLQMNPPTLHEFDIHRYQTLMNKKATQRFKVTSFSHQHIVGTITTEQTQGYLLMTMPYDSNWTITVDNKPVTAVPVLNNTLMAIPISKGNHQIVMHYFPKSIYYGTMLSMFGVVGYIILNRQRLKSKKI